MSESEESDSEVSSDEETEGTPANPMVHLRDWILFRFKHKGPRKRVESIDMVPFGWTDIDKKGNWTTQFLESMEEKEDLDTLHQLVQDKVKAPKGRPKYSIEIIGRAKTYKEVVKKLEKLKRVKNVLTADEAHDAEEIEKGMRNEMKRFKLLKEAKKIKKRLASSEESSLKRPSDQVNPESYLKKIHKDVPNNTTERTLLPVDLNSSPVKSDGVLAQNSDGSLNSKKSSPVRTIQSSPPQKEVGCEENQQQQEEDSGAMEVEIMDLSNVNDFEFDVLIRLNGMEKTQKLIQEDQKLILKNQKETKIMLNSLLESNAEADLSSFEDKHNLDIPFKTLDEFLKFNDSLLNNALLKKDMIESFKTCLDKDLSITRTMVRILEKFINKDVISNFTAVKTGSDKSKEKKIFYELQFCKNMCGFIKAKREHKFKEEVPEQHLKDSLSEVFTNIKKWT